MEIRGHRRGASRGVETKTLALAGVLGLVEDLSNF